MRRSNTPILSASLVLFVALLACKQSSDGPAPTTSSKPTEAVPAPTVASAPTPNARTAPADIDEKGIPAIPDGRSDPPSVTEWTAAREVNTQDPNSRPKDCFMKIVREWLKVHCEGDIKSVSEMVGLPKASSDYFELVQQGKLADFVFRLKKGGTMSMKIHRAGNRASLFVNWPATKDRPSNVAMAQIKEGD